jgi:hypothetical protein
MNAASVRRRAAEALPPCAAKLAIHVVIVERRVKSRLSFAPRPVRIPTGRECAKRCTDSNPGNVSAIVRQFFDSIDAGRIAHRVARDTPARF